MSSSAHTRKSYPLNFKLKVIQAVNDGEKKADVCRKFDIKSSMLSKWLKNEVEWKKLQVSNGNISRKRKREGELPDLEDHLYNWFVLKREQKAEISSDILIEKAKVFASEFYGGLENFG